VTRSAAADRASLVGRIRGVAARTDLLLSLTHREVQVRYKQAFLGMAWAVFLPLSLMLVTTALRSGLAPGWRTSVPYAVFSYCGILPWTFHQVALKGCTGTLVTNKNLMQKVYFPREIFPLAKIGAALVDFGVGLLVLAALMAWYRVAPTAAMLLLPVVVLVHLMLVVGLGLALAAANVFFRDVQYVFDVVVLVWMFASPVFVETRGRHFVGGIDVFADLNPMHPILEAYRDVLVSGGLSNPWHFALGAAWSAGILLLGFLVFARWEPLFAERA
jgi:ABC-type polysaccharide/polyol phosphate export permease